MYILKHFDLELIRFEFGNDPLEGQTCHIISINHESEEMFPIGMKLTDRGLLSWLRSRIIPKNREYVDSFLAKNGLSHNDTEGILKISKGLSLNDCYWVVEDGFSGLFKDYNLYEHDFLKVLALIAYTGYGSTRIKEFSSSPEFTTGGMLRKSWRKQNGKILLYKGGTSGAANTGREPYSEYYAAQIAEKMGLYHVPYNLSVWKKSLCSTCELFCDIDTSFVPIYRFVEDCNLRNVAEYLIRLGEDYYNAFADMLVFDAVIYNEDRHFGNFGIMVDSHTNKPIRFAPVFDNGLSLFNYAMPDDYGNLGEYAKTRSSSYGVSFDSIAAEFISKRQRDMLRKLIGFRFARHSSYNLPAAHLNAIEKHIGERVRVLLDIPEKHSDGKNL